MSKIHLFNVGSEDQISGGYLYNKYLVEELRTLGTQVNAHFLNGGQTLESSFVEVVDSEDIVLIDSLLLVQESDFVLAQKDDFKIHGLIHLPQFFDPEKAERHETIFKIEKQLFQSIPLIVTSDYIKKEIYKTFEVESNKIAVVDPAVAVSNKKENFADHPQKFISVGNVVERKGYHLMIEGLALLNDLDWQLDIYGNVYDGLYFEKLRQTTDQFKMQEKIHFRGTVSHSLVNQKMIEADLLLNTSLFETYNMILAESLANGLPFVSTKVGAFEKFDSYKGGVFFDGFEKEAFANALRKLVVEKSNYKKLYTENLPFENRTWRNVAEEFLSIFS